MTNSKAWKARNASEDGSQKKIKLLHPALISPMVSYNFSAFGPNLVQNVPATQPLTNIDHLRLGIDHYFDSDIENIPNQKKQDYIEKQKQQLHNLLSSLISEVSRNTTKCVRKGPCREEMERLDRDNKRKFQSRVDLMCSLLQMVFKTEDSDAVIALLALFRPKSISILQEVHGLKVKEYRFTEHQVLHMKHHIGGSASYRMMERMGRGLSSASDGFVKFPLANAVSKYKNQLPIGSVSIFQSPW